MSSDILSIYALYLEHRVICTDSRNLAPGSLFFALKGANFNGNAFAFFALTHGAAYAVTDEAIDDIPDMASRVIKVPDVLRCLQDLARHHRLQLSIPVIGITGSNGKTTSKELLASVLSQRFKTFATAGNLNNHIGVPLSILSVGPTVEVAIIEMGANHQHEIEFLCTISQPNLGFVTNVGLAHLEGFGGFEGVKKGKKELFDWLLGVRGLAFVQAGSADLVEMSRGVERRVFYGKDALFTVSGNEVANASSPFLSLEWRYVGDPGRSYTVQTRLTGSYNLENTLAAVSVGLHLGFTAAEINAGLAAYEPTNNRSQFTEGLRNKLLLDHYNANPTSMAASIDNFAKLSAPAKMVILGDMFELGKETRAEHERVLHRLDEFEPDSLFILIGPSFGQFKAEKDNDDRFKFFSTTPEAFNFLMDESPAGYLIMVKGSHGMQLEKLVPLL